MKIENTYLTKNFTLHEMVRSCTAQRRGIDNTPSVEALNNLGHLCREILQPIREMWHAPIIVSSGYRCPALNKAVGGVTNSDHIHGCAADIKTLADTPDANKALFNLIRHLHKYGHLPKLKQCIDEYGYDWLHVSYQDGRSAKLGQLIHISK